MKKDPCQKQACAIQYCLQRNSYQESKCQVELLALKDCCKKWSKESGCCTGVKVENSNSSSEALKTLDKNNNNSGELPKTG